MNDFAVTERTRVKRIHERGHYDRETVHAILDAGMICHMGFAVDGKPFVVPTAYWREDDTIYVHGSSASRTLRSLRGGIEVCIAVTHVDGLVLARSGFHHSINYRSVMIFGTAELVEDADERMAALKAFMDRVTPGRWDEVRPPDAQEFKATMVLRVPLVEVSAKVRTGPPIDDDDDYALPCWAGVVPLGTATGQPIPDPKLPDGVPVPDYATNFKLG